MLRAGLIVDVGLVMGRKGLTTDFAEDTFGDPEYSSW